MLAATMPWHHEQQQAWRISSAHADSARPFLRSRDVALVPARRMLRCPAGIAHADDLEVPASSSSSDADGGSQALYQAVIVSAGKRQAGRWLRPLPRCAGTSSEQPTRLSGKVSRNKRPSDQGSSRRSDGHSAGEPGGWTYPHRITACPVRWSSQITCFLSANPWRRSRRVSGGDPNLRCRSPSKLSLALRDVPGYERSTLGAI